MSGKNKKGFGLIEVLVGTAVFLIFAVGIYSGVRYIFKVIYLSRLRVIETGILNEQMELVRNLSYYNVGIVNGSPSGTLQRVVTTTIDGIDFTITRTVRAIDHEFDGTLGGDPNDISPVDYKYVQVEIICDHCGQNNSLTMGTYISSQYLEGDPDHGGLFVEVYDAEGNPVRGATVRVLATSTDPTIDLYETTNNDGFVALLDLGEGMSAYHVTVTKDGYITDGTTVPSAEVPDPVKPPASVEAQEMTKRSFEIDQAASISVNTINTLCQAVSGVDVNVYGTELIGTVPDVLLVNDLFTTGAGAYLLEDLKWDYYDFAVGSHDLVGTIPAPPLRLYPGSNMDVDLVVGPASIRSFVVVLLDNTTGEPISGATVEITAIGEYESGMTGVGFINQTDWSGGSGQLNMVDQTRYYADDGNIEVNNPAGDIKLENYGGVYAAGGVLESSIYDLGVSVDFVDLSWRPYNQPTESGTTSLRFQIATGDASGTSTWKYLGPDGTSSTYYNKFEYDISDVHDGDRYMRYKVYLSTDDTDHTPILSELNINYSEGCVPPGQVYFPDIKNKEYTITATHADYDVASESVYVDKDESIVVIMNMIKSG